MAASIFENWVCAHTQYVTSCDLLAEEVKRALCGGSPFVFPLLGESRAGKSTLLKDIEARFSKSLSASGHHRVLRISVPPAASLEALAETIIVSILGNVTVTGKIFQKIQRARRTMQEAGVVILMIDEINHLVERRSTLRAQTKENRQIADWIKELVDLSQISVVIAGLPHVARIYADNDQLANRGLVGITLYPYNWSVAADREQYVGMVTAAIENFEENGWSVDVDHDRLIRVAYLGGAGYIGKARDLCVRIEEIGSGKRALTLKLLSRAFRDKYQLNSTGDPTELAEIRDELLNAAHRDALAKASYGWSK